MHTCCVRCSHRGSTLVGVGAVGNGAQDVDSRSKERHGPPAVAQAQPSEGQVSDKSCSWSRAVETLELSQDSKRSGSLRQDSIHRHTHMLAQDNSLAVACIQVSCAMNLLLHAWWGVRGQYGGVSEGSMLGCQRAAWWGVRGQHAYAP